MAGFVKVFQVSGIEVGGTGGVIVASPVSVACCEDMVGTAIQDGKVGIWVGVDMDIVEDVETG